MTGESKTSLKKRVKNLLDRNRFTSSLRLYTKELRGAHWAFFHGNHGSPIPDRAEVEALFQRLGTSQPTLPGINLRKEGQFALLEQFRSHYQTLPFPIEPDPAFRYHLGSGCFGSADGIFLHSFLRHFRPRRIIEFGTGWSSMVLLDTLAHAGPDGVSLTFIEPWASNVGRLRGKLTPAEVAGTRILEQGVRDLDPSVFDSLEPGDLLLIASSHVVKCGSDLQRFLFEVLPALPVGVFVHFHGVLFPFEYPAEAMAEGPSHNECYFLRAFLSYNDSWEIVLFNHYVDQEFRSYLTEHMPLCLRTPGSGLFIRRCK